MSYGVYTTAPGTHPGSHSKKYKNSPGGLGGGGGGGAGLRDNLTAVGFSVPYTSTVNVSGGGNALNVAVGAAAAGTRLLIQDSLDYSIVTVNGKTNIAIEAAPGQYPTVTSAPGADDGCLVIANAVSGLAIRRISFFGNNNITGSQTVDGMVGGSSAFGMTLERLIIEDCTFQELDATVTLGGPGIQIHGTDGVNFKQVWIHRCVFINTASHTTEASPRDWGPCTVSGFDQVYIQNCVVKRTAVLPRATSTMKGFVFRSNNVVIEDCLVNDIGTGGNNVCFYSNDMGFGVTINGSSTVRNCVAYNTARTYRVTQAGATMTVTASVASIDIPGIGNSGGVQKFVVAQFAGTLTFSNGIISLVAGEGSVYGDGSATPTHTFNDVFGGFLDPATPLAPSEIAVNPVFSSVGLHDWRSTAAATQTAASDGGVLGVRYPGGEVITWAGVP
jgi:hypothetical protein